MAERDELQKMMDEYKSNYVQYLTTGNSSYKTAYQNAQSALESMVNNKQEEVESQKADMQSFLNSYEEGNDEVSEEYDRATNLYSNAQKIDDEYKAAKNRYDLYMQKTPSMPTIDLSVGYSMISSSSSRFLIEVDRSGAPKPSTSAKTIGEFGTLIPTVFFLLRSSLGKLLLALRMKV